MSKRKTRAKEFKTPQNLGWISFTQDMVSSAFLLLQQASRERKPEEQNRGGGHYCVHGPGSILLICTAFDQWLNESSLSLNVRYPGLREAAVCMSTLEKYYEFSKLISGKKLNKDKDLEMAWDVRNEIVHLLPRKTNSGKTWPHWLGDLNMRGIVLKAELPGQGDATDLSTKLHSYRLARWIWEVINSAILRLLSSFSEENEFERDMISWTASGFSMYKSIPEWALPSK